MSLYVTAASHSQPRRHRGRHRRLRTYRLPRWIGHPLVQPLLLLVLFAGWLSAYTQTYWEPPRSDEVVTGDAGQQHWCWVDGGPKGFSDCVGTPWLFEDPMPAPVIAP